MFPVSVLPAWVQRISWLISLTYSLDGLRAALLRGASLADMSKPSRSWRYLPWFFFLPVSTFCRPRCGTRAYGTLSFW